MREFATPDASVDLVVCFSVFLVNRMFEQLFFITFPACIFVTRCLCVAVQSGAVFLRGCIFGTECFSAPWRGKCGWPCTAPIPIWQNAPYSFPSECNARREKRFRICTEKAEESAFRLSTNPYMKKASETWLFQAFTNPVNSTRKGGRGSEPQPPLL